MFKIYMFSFLTGLLLVSAIPAAHCQDFDHLQIDVQSLDWKVQSLEDKVRALENPEMSKTEIAEKYMAKQELEDLKSKIDELESTMGVLQNDVHFLIMERAATIPRNQTRKTKTRHVSVKNGSKKNPK